MADVEDTSGAGVQPPEPDQGDIGGQANSPTPEEPTKDDRSHEELERDAGQPLGSDADVTRTAGPGAEATLAANVGPSEVVMGVPDAALGQHAVDENRAVTNPINPPAEEAPAPAPTATKSTAKSSS